MMEHNHHITMPVLDSTVTFDYRKCVDCTRGGGGGGGGKSQ